MTHSRLDDLVDMTAAVENAPEILELDSVNGSLAALCDDDSKVTTSLVTLCDNAVAPVQPGELTPPVMQCCN